MNPWAILGVKPGNTEADLSRAYRRKVFDAHPDRGGDEAEAKRLTAAYEALKELVVDGRLVASRPTPKPQVVQQGVVIEVVFVGFGDGFWPSDPTTSGHRPTGSW